MPYLGNTPADRFTTTTVDTFNGDNSTTEFTLSRSATTNDVEVLVENVQQQPTTAYSISGTTLTFTSAPPTGTGNIYVIHRGAAISSVTPANGTVSVDMLSATGTKSGSTFLAGDNSFKTVAVTPTAVSSQANTATDFFALPKGTTAQRPGSPDNGYIRYNTTEDYIEEYRNGSWVVLSNVFDASGGTKTTDTVGGVTYNYHTFTSSDTFTVASGTSTVDMIIVGGGGAGGQYGGGGGAGAVLHTQNLILASGSYDVVIGAGGSPSNVNTAASGREGEATSVAGLSAPGGGGGGCYQNVPASGGANGGGAGAYGSNNGSPGGTGTVSPQSFTTVYGGNDGGNQSTVDAGFYPLSGGAGAGGNGFVPPNGNGSSPGGNGGVGIQISGFDNNNYYWAGGGGGGLYEPAGTGGTGGNGGIGGGGAANGSATGGGSSLNSGQNSVDNYYAGSGGENTGSGGGGGAYNNGTGTPTGGQGGSGIVIIRYAV